MLKTALRPRSILALVLSLAVAAGFVLLSQWQLESSGRSRTVADPAKDVARPLAQTDRPGTAVTVPEADQLVSATGTYRDSSTVLLPGRLQDGAQGWWVVSALTLPGTQWPDADGPVAVAVARGWVADPAQVPDEPGGAVGVVGRYLPPEGPLPREGMPAGQVGSLSPAQLTNLWDVPLHAGFVAAFAESPAGEPLQLDGDGTLAADPSLLSPGLSRLQIGQQPTDESVDLLNLFYAVEWVVFAGFALYIWWRFVRDRWLREQHPEEYFYLDGDYYRDEASGRYYYYDPEAGEYYWFDDQPADPSRAPGHAPGHDDRSPTGTQNRTGAHHD